MCLLCIFVFKQKTAYEMLISDWSSDVCSSDLAFFLSGAQIDGRANINLVSIGDPDRPKAQFPGSFGSGYLYYVVPRVILFRLEHTVRTLVEKVDFVSAPGISEPSVHRPGGPYKLITDRCLFGFARTRARFTLESVHPGHTAEEVAEHTGFAYDAPAEIGRAHG